MGQGVTPDLAPSLLEQPVRMEICSQHSPSWEEEVGKHHGFGAAELCIRVKLHKPWLSGSCPAEIKSEVSAHVSPGPCSKSGFE